MNEEEKREYEYYLKHRRYLINIYHFNGVSYKILFLIYIIIIYFNGIKTDIFSFIFMLIFSIFLLEGIRLTRKTNRLINEWDYKYNNS